MERRIKMLLSLMAILFTLSYLNCSNSAYNEDVSMETISILKSSDSIYFNKVIYSFIDSNFNYFNNFKYFKIPIKNVTFWVDQIYYSPDSLKLIATIIDREPNNNDTKSKNKDSTYYYDGFAFISYRKSIESPLVIYKFNYYSIHGWESYIQVKRLHIYHLEQNLKEQSEFIWDKENNKWSQLMPFDYNVTDSLFWSKSIVWQKGTIIPDYFTFEVDRVGISDDSIHGVPRMDGINLMFR